MRTDLRIDPRTRVAAFAITALLVAGGLLPVVSAQTTVDTVDLGTADPFAILAGETATNTGPSVINGDIGLHPGDSVTGFDEATVNGEFHIADDVAEQAKVDLTAAYNDAAGRPDATELGTELGGQNLTSGVYDSAAGTFGLTGTLTLDAEGNESAVWIFQMESTLTTASDSSVVLINGAQACNVFWQVGSSATLGTDTAFVGNILAHTSITMNNNATLDGRALANGGSVTLDTNGLKIAECAESDSTDDSTDGSTDEEQQAPVCPEGLSAQAHGNEDITLSWNASVDADTYHVYRATGDGAFEHVAEVTSTSYTDTDTEAGTTYTYEVTAANEAGESEDCDQVEVTAIPFFGTPAVIAMAAIGSIGIVAILRARRG